ncbi:hypothetical protein [Streptomyces sp. NBC_01565]|uniref:hypothetical protein n=1 Tax=Streptomyces sp. NBC_01565 TaxID=2975881 RepID=UPI002253F266|nr:hypothetical protein [Streptomyces sp. NBC_01565]MCX4539934.1 hypothetical protein [Streptomyces sp. NBC_01565]
MAGESPLDLPALSRTVGPGTQLTADCSGHQVIWAASEAGGTIAFEDLTTQEALARIPVSALTTDARHEYQHLLRCTLAADPRTALQQIDDLLAPHTAALDLLKDLREQVSHTSLATSAG